MGDVSIHRFGECGVLSLVFKCVSLGFEVVSHYDSADGLGVWFVAFRLVVGRVRFRVMLIWLDGVSQPIR